MKYILVEDTDDTVYRFNIFAINNNTKYVFGCVYCCKTIPELLLRIEGMELYQAEFHDSWLDHIIFSFDELPTLSYIEQHYPELLI